MPEEIEIKIPDIGSTGKVDVIEILVKPGDVVKENDSLLTLESDKASMEVPSPFPGTISKLLTKVGDKVAEGSPILILKTEAKKEAAKDTQISAQAEKQEDKPEDKQAIESPKEQELDLPKPNSQEGGTEQISAGPAVRRFARELGVNLSDVAGSERGGRITKEDIEQYVKARMTGGAAPSGTFALPEQPTMDFAKFGPIETKALHKIKRLTAQQMHRAWLTVPHVTQFDEADVTDLEAFRLEENEKGNALGYKLTILAFVVKAVCKALASFPQFNTSLDSSGSNLIYKHYMNIGIAVETPNGLVVPVIKQANQLTVGDIALEMARLSQKAREKGIEPADISGGTFTISSLGGIGGTAFTPIVNNPEVAILGVSKALIKPVYDGEEFVPRLMLPLSLSYDHRVIDGAEAARFAGYLVELLSDIRKIIL